MTIIDTKNYLLIETIELDLTKNEMKLLMLLSNREFISYDELKRAMGLKSYGSITQMVWRIQRKNNFLVFIKRRENKKTLIRLVNDIKIK